MDGLEGNHRDNRQDFPTSTTTPVRFPWSDLDRAHDWTRVYKYLLDNPSGVPLSRLCECLFGDISSEGRTYSTKDYEATRRFLESSDIAVLNVSGPQISAQPSLEAFSLDLGKQISNRNAEQPTEALESPKNTVSGQLQLSHKEFTRSLVSAIDGIHSVETAQTVARPYLRYLDSIEDKHLIFEDQTMPAENYMLMPYHTRFNDEKRCADQWRRYHNAWDRATDRYTDGVHLTLTTDPNRYDSIKAMTDGIFKAWGKLLETLNNRYGGDSRLDYIRALEWTTKGYPHLHVVVFGVRYVPHSWLSHYWATNCDHGEMVWCDRLSNRGSEWIHHNKQQQENFNAKAYLGDYLSKTFENIEIGVTEQFNEVTDLEGAQIGAKKDGSPLYDYEQCGIWKMALYWATGRQFWDCSHGLKEPNPDCLQDVPGLGETKLERLQDAGIHTLSHIRLASRDDLEEIDGLGASLVSDLLHFAGEPSDFDLGRWTFKGAASYEQIPLHVVQNATVLGVPPLSSEGATS